jgi:hypothetical protein
MIGCYWSGENMRLLCVLSLTLLSSTDFQDVFFLLRKNKKRCETRQNFKCHTNSTMHRQDYKDQNVKSHHVPLLYSGILG